MDEVAEIGIASQPLGRVVLGRDGFPPLHFLLAHFWLGSGSDPATLRVLSVIFGTLTILAMWQLGRVAGREPAGLVSAFLIAISPLHIWFSQEARPYSLYFLLAVLGIWLFYRAWTMDRAGDWMWYLAVAALGLYAHYYYALLLLTLLATVLWELRPWSALRRLVLTHGALAVLMVPWLLLARDDLSVQQAFILARPPIDLTALGYAWFTFLAGFAIGPSLRELHTARALDAIRALLPWVLLLGMSALYLGGRVLRNPAQRVWAWRLGFLVVLPVGACGLLGAWLGVGFRVRYIAWCAAPLLVLLALGVALGPRSWRTWLAVAALTGVSAVSLINRWTVDRYKNEDVRGAARYLASATDGTTPVFVVSGYMASPLRYYTGPAMKVRGLPGPDSTGTPTEALGQIRDAVNPTQPFWLVYTRAFDGDSEGRLLQVLQEQAGLTHRAALPGIEIYEGKGF